MNVQCRFCLEDDTHTNVIAPCLCKGSAKYVHELCLSKWYEKKPESGYKCSSCMFIYNRSYSKEYETIKSIYIPKIPYSSNPFVCILFHHWVFFLGTRAFVSEKNYKILLHNGSN
jgi:E3 ubiquitin-protein ligase DOA10